MSGRTPDNHIAAARTRLAHLDGLARRTQDAEQTILDSAMERLETVRADQDKLRPRVQLDPDAADAYVRLTTERARLEQVIANARRNLAPPERG